MKTIINSLLITLPIWLFNGSLSSPNEAVKMIIKEKTAYQDYKILKNIVMNTQGNSKTTFDNSAWLLPEFKLIGPCTFKENEKNIALLAYYTSNGVSIYSPSNATNIIKNYRCNGIQYEALIMPSEWKATRFRVLLPSNKRQQAIYNAYNSGNMTKLSDDLFKGISEPSSSAIRYSSTEDPASNIFNTTDAYLIWAKIPSGQGSINVLLHIKEVIENENLSTLKFDLAVPKS